MSLHFSGEQLDDLSRQRFESKLIALIEETEPEAGPQLRAPEGLAELRRQRARAAQYGIVSEADQARYVLTAWQLGPDFDTRHAAMQEILGAERLSPAQKVDAIERICLAVLNILSQEAR